MTKGEELTIRRCFGTVALVVGTSQSRDPLFQRDPKWLGLVLGAAVLEFVNGTAVSALFPSLSTFDFYSYYALPGGFLGIIVAYFLYWSA
jgi:hypothetical protein